MSAKTYTAAGATFSIGSTAVGNLKTFAFTDPKITYEDTTNLGSQKQGTIIVKEQTPTMVTPGEFTAQGYYIPTDAGLAAIRASFANTALSTFTVQYPPDTNGNVQVSTGDEVTWTGYVTSFPLPDGADAEKPMTYKIDGIMITMPVLTVGS